MTINTMGDIIRAMNAGEIRSFKEQNDVREREGIPVTALEADARRVYLGHIITTENPVRLP